MIGALGYERMRVSAKRKGMDKLELEAAVKSAEAALAEAKNNLSAFINSMDNNALESVPTISTKTLAAQLQIKPQTLRAALCRDGHYYGVRPIKMPNRILRWPADAAAFLIRQALI